MLCCKCKIELDENNCYDVYLSVNKNKRIKNKKSLLCDKCYFEKKDNTKKTNINPEHIDLFDDYITKINDKINEEQKKQNDNIIIRIFDFDDNDEVDKKEICNKRKRKEDEEEKIKELEKNYDFEWLGDDIYTINDLIRLGKEYTKRQKKKKKKKDII